MDKLKSILKSDTPTTDQPQPTRTASGKLTGQGSHFPGNDETAIGSTVTGTEPQTRGPADVSAAPANITAAATTTGPEQGGSSHIGTISSTAATQPAASNTIEDYSVSSADFPKAETARDESGTAAVGQTSTYSASHLAGGDPTPSTVNPQSSDPLSYKKPEAGSHTAGTGVGAGAAATAASLAFAAGEQRQTSMAGNENPYRASTLDPRVDGLSKSSAGNTSTATAAAGTGIASAGAATAYSSHRQQDDVVVPSTLTTTADPAERSAEYGTSVHEKGLSTASGVTPAQTSNAAAAPSTTADENSQGILGRALGAVGLGSVAGALGVGAATSSDTTAIADTPEQPTTTTGLTSYTAPTQQGPPTSHHRKESIPTTAYPSGTLDSVRAINPPIGGAGSPVVYGDSQSHTGRDVAVGTGAGFAAAGSAAVGVHEYEKSKGLREDISGEPQATAPVLKEAGETRATSGVDTSQYQGSQTLRQNIAEQPTSAVSAQPSSDMTEQPSSGISTAHHATTIGDGTPSAPVGTATSAPAITSEGAAEKDHTARDAAVGAGAGAAVAGAGAYGAHEYSKKEAEKAEAEAAKAQKAAEKEEKHHQKELEKEEKHHQKELEKEEKHRQREAEAARERREKEAAGVAGAGTVAAEEKEKKPSIFKRIFKRRKNKDTGDSEDYSSDEESASHQTGAAAAYGSRVVGGDAVAHEATTQDTAHYTAVNPEEPHNKEAKAAYGAALLGAGTGGVAAMEDSSRHPDHPGETSELSSYEKASGGAQKPSYNPLSKEAPFVGAAGDQSGPTSATATSETAATTTTMGSASHPTEAITGLPYDASKDPEAARRLTEHQHGAGIGTFDRGDAAVGQGEMERAAATHQTTTGTVAPTTLESTGTRTMQPTEAVTGTTAPTGTYTRSTAPGTLDNTGSATAQPIGAVTGLSHGEREATAGTDTGHSAAGGYVAPTNFTLGEVEKSEPLHHTAAGEGTSGNLPINTNFTLGEVSTGKEESQKSSGGIGEKIKEALHIGSHKKESE